MTDNQAKNIIIGMFVLFLLFVVVLYGFFPKHSLAYKQGVLDTHKEAYSKGLMIKDITPDDKVVYRWKQ